MLSEAVKASGSSRVFTNLGLAAFEVALTQQRVFEKTLQELAARQEQAKAAHERKAAADKQQGDNQDNQKVSAKSKDHVVDVVVGGHSDSGSSPAGNSSPTTDARGSNVDVAV